MLGRFLRAGDRDACRPTRRPSRTCCSCSTTCSTSSATPTCRASPTHRPTWSRRSSARPPSSARTCSPRSTAVGDNEGCTRHDDGSVTTPKGFKDAYRADRRRRLDRHLGAERVRRPGPADVHDPAGQRVPVLGQPGLRDVSRPDPGRDRRDPGARHAGAEGALPAEDGGGRMDRHHEPHRAALRHRPRPDPHQGGEAGRRQLQDHRHQDLHLRRRARPGGEHRPSRAGAHRRRAGGHQGHLAVHRAEAAAQRRRLARRAQRRRLRLARREDGHPRQRHLRDELRRRDRLADRRGEPRPARHVHDDERGAAGGRRAGARDLRGRLPERRHLREGAPAGPRAQRREVQGQAGRSDHRASRRAAHADDHQVVQRGRRARW